MTDNFSLLCFCFCVFVSIVF